MSRADRRDPGARRRRGHDRRGPARSARRAAWEALRAFAADPSTRVDDVMDTRGLSGRDIALAVEIARGTVRRQRLLDHVLAGLCARGLPESPGTRAALRVGAYQLVFLERVPAHAAVDESVRLVGQKERGFVNAVLRRVATSVRTGAADPDRRRTEVEVATGRMVRVEVPLPDPLSDPSGHLAVVSGLPGFLLQRWIGRYGEARTRQLAEAANRTPGVHLRAVGISRDELASALAGEGVETVESEHPRLLRWTGGTSPLGTNAFRRGRFVVQDPTAVRAAEAVDAQEGQTVLDLCAAPGTKASLLAEAVGPTGSLLAHDVDPARRARIVETADRLAMPWLRAIEDVAGVADVDAVLVDVPCSNTGVLARRVEVRHRLLPHTFESLSRLQRELLERGIGAVRPGGRVVYSTCSIEPDECDDVVDAAAGTRDDVEILERVSTFPDPPHHDGGYHAVLHRRGGDSVAGSPSSGARG